MGASGMNARVFKDGVEITELFNVELFTNVTWREASSIYRGFWLDTFHHGNFEENKEKLERIINIIEESDLVKIKIKDEE